MFISLHQDTDYLNVNEIYSQDSTRVHLKPVDVGIALMKVDDESDGHELQLVTYSGLVVDNQVQINAVLTVGVYVVVLLSTGCNFDTYRAIETNNNVDSTCDILFDSQGKLVAKAIAAFDEIFGRIDSDLDGVRFACILGCHT